MVAHKMRILVQSHNGVYQYTMVYTGLSRYIPVKAHIIRWDFPICPVITTITPQAPPTPTPCLDAPAPTTSPNICPSHHHYWLICGHPLLLAHLSFGAIASHGTPLLLVAPWLPLQSMILPFKLPCCPLALGPVPTLAPTQLMVPHCCHIAPPL